jgi:hypothetical protein
MGYVKTFKSDDERATVTIKGGFIRDEVSLVVHGTLAERRSYYCLDLSAAAGRGEKFRISGLGCTAAVTFKLQGIMARPTHCVFTFE